VSTDMLLTAPYKLA